MTPEFIAILNRISGDFKLLADAALKAMGNEGSQVPGEADPQVRDDITLLIATVPTIKETYTDEEAEIEKARIDHAFRAQLISYDKKRGMKMLVTKRTDGWSPIK